MRVLMAGLGATLATFAMTAPAADAQRGARGAGYPMPGRTMAARPGGTPTVAMRPGVHPGGGGQWQGGGRWQGGGQRWQKQGGRWVGGWNAPGGWGGYRQPVVGWTLPGYWVQPGFVVSDWAGYGLAQPPVGYSWSRYYDDAVLIDGRGAVHDTVGSVDWDGRGGADYAYDDGGYDEGVAPPPPGYAPQRRDSGLGGAAIGAVAGGVAGNLIAGRGNRLGGTLIGAGVGGVAGYAIDRAEDRGGRARAGAGYPPPQGYAPPPPPHGRVIQGGAPYSYVSPDGRTTVSTGGGHYGGGYGSTTTVVVQSAPVVTTTTTTEYYDDVVTWRKPAKRKVWRRPTKTICRC